ncbi:putative mannosyltransferase [Yasminevirus sp. GU-2018]|uniref:Putative mannosyltransferase n=1 Tax=Yasminevirus sp. GU-2018 TaxID=2420051 RepID=A0A5K0UBH0_9VIRU|nr:putative mannosyltransferase [Yasminevirus sp. GU-2018]
MYKRSNQVTNQKLLRDINVSTVGQSSSVTSYRSYDRSYGTQRSQPISLLRDVREQNTSSIKFRNNIDLTLNVNEMNRNDMNRNDMVSSVFSSDTKSAPEASEKISYYISLTTTPSRFFKKTVSHEGVVVTDEFADVLSSLSNQTFKPDKIFVSLCYTYSRKFAVIRDDSERTTRIRELKDKFPLVEILDATDYGPATKLLGLLEYDQKKPFLQKNDVIVVVDDDLLYSENLMYSHAVGMQLYNSDMVAVNQDVIVRTLKPYTFKLSDIFYRDNYDGFLYGWLSFSVRAGVTAELFNFYKEITKLFTDIVYHDDLIFTMYMYLYKLYVVESRFVPLHHDVKNDRSLRELYKVPPYVIDRSVNKINSRDARTELDSVDALRDRPLPSGLPRSELEKQVFSFYGVHVGEVEYEGRFLERDVNYRIQKSIPRRDRIVSYVDDITVDVAPEDIHVLFTYLDSKNVLMTITIFNEDLTKTDIDYQINIKLNGKKYAVFFTANIDDLTNTNSSQSKPSTKFSHILYFANETIKRKSVQSTNYTVLQTCSNSLMSRGRFYSISTVLNASIELPYRFFDDDDVYKFVADNYSKMVYDAVFNLVPGAYTSDVFRYCYLYLNGGVYIDCKKIMYVTFSDFINYYKKTVGAVNFATLNTTGYGKGTGFEIFIKDCPRRMAYNAVMVCDKMSKTVKVALMYSVFMIINNLYTDDPLNITGPGCLGDAIDYVYAKNYKYAYTNVIPPGRGSADSYIVDLDLIKTIKNTYYGYYDENNYINTTHYHKLWHSRQVYKQNLSLKYPNIKKVSDVVLSKSVLESEQI